MAVMSGSANLKTVGAFNGANTYTVQRDSIVYVTGDSIGDVYWEYVIPSTGDTATMLIASASGYNDDTSGQPNTANLRFGQSNFVKDGTTIYMNGFNLYLHILEIDEDY